jgi:hypothetical protein
MQAIKTGNNHEINKMNMEYQHEKEMWDKNNPKEEVPTPDDEEEYVRPQQSGDKFDQDTGEPIKPAGSQQSNQWHTSQQLTSPTKPTKPGKEDDDVTMLSQSQTSHWHWAMALKRNQQKAAEQLTPKVVHSHSGYRQSERNSLTLKSCSPR